jgi:hypothetical protein
MTLRSSMPPPAPLASLGHLYRDCPAGDQPSGRCST